MAIIPAESFLPELAKKHRLYVILRSDPFLSHWTEQLITQQLEQKQRLRVPDAISPEALGQHLLQVDLFQGDKTWIIDCNKPALLKDSPLVAIVEKCLKQTNHTLLITLENTNAGHQRSTWFKQLSKLGLCVSTKALSPYKIGTWLEQYSKHLGKPIKKNISNTLAEQLNYHLPSLAQLCTQMQIQDIQPPLSLDRLQGCLLTNPGTGPIYEILDHICSGNYKSFLQAIHKNHPQDSIISLYWMLLKRLRQILHIYEQCLLSKKPLSQVLQQHNLWTKQQSVFTRCLRTPKAKLFSLYQELAELEWVLKGRKTGNFVPTFIQTCTQLCHTIHEA